MTRPLAIWIALACVVAVPAVASAKPRVALTPFEGDPGGEVEDAVVNLLDGDLQIVTPKQVSRAADKLGLDGELSDKDLKKISNELEADAVVQTKLSTRGSNKVLRFKLFVHGKSAKGFKIEFASLKSAKFKQMLHDKMVDKVGAGKSDDDAAADDKPAKKKKAAADDADDKPAKKKKVAAADDADDKPAKKKKAAAADDDAAADDKPAKKKKAAADDDAAADDKPAKKKAADDDAADDKPAKPAADDEDDKPRKSKKRTAHRGDDDDGGDVTASSGEPAAKLGAHAANRVAVRVDVGMSVMTRKLTYASLPSPSAPNPYTNTPVGGGRVEGELFPLAFQDPKSPVAGLGIAGDFDQTLSLAVTSSTQMGTRFPVTERHWSIGARYRLVLGGGPQAPSITLGFGYGHREFKIDRSALMPGNVILLPNTLYVGYLPGVDFRIPIAGAVALVFGGKAYLMTSTGDIQLPQNFGGAKVTGGEGMAGIDIVIGNRYAVRLVGELAQVGFSFVGNGTLSQDANGNKLVGGASDRYLGGAATLAVMY